MSDTVIEVEQLTKRFGKRVAVDGIDLRIERGECVGILGPNGAGKTTTLEILEGLQEPTSGTVLVLGMSWATDAARIRPRIGVQLQETRYQGPATVAETLDLFRSFYGSGLSTEEAISLLQLEEKANDIAERLSGGQLQRLSLAVAIISNPELLFLDEPTTGLDPQARQSLWDVILALKARGTTLLLTTHYMAEAERLCDRIIVIDAGKIVAQGTPKALISALNRQRVLELDTDPPLAAELFGGLPGVVRQSYEGGQVRLVVEELAEALPSVTAFVLRSGARLTRLSTREPTLEDVFLSKTGRAREGTAK